ncbi:MAG: NAD(P)H-binding protein [Actinomycetota bacterium]|nr:NAD(P)H-binding protein [Actinomycetota bacterium]
MKILITGGRGSLGRLVEPILEDHEVQIGSRTARNEGQVRFDLADPATIERAVVGIQVVIHLATDPFHSDVEIEGSRALFAAVQEAGLQHLVFVSIVGIDAHPYPYYRTKLAIEDSLTTSDVPWTILRATQFHSLVPRFVDGLRRSPIMPVPTGVRLQPIDPVLVARRVAELVSAGPAGRVEDMGGPEVLELGEMVRDYLAVAKRRRLVVPVPLWGGAVEAFRRGDVLTDRVVPGGRTYREFLAEAL